MLWHNTQLKALNAAQFAELLHQLEVPPEYLPQNVAQVQVATQVLQFIKNQHEGEKRLEEVLQQLRILARKSTRKISDVPSLLPYLLDCKPQELEFSDAIKQHRAVDNPKRNRPFVCWVHGKEQYSYEMLLHRLIKRELKSTLVRYDSVFRHNTPIREPYPLSCSGFRTPDELHKLIRRSLDNTLRTTAKHDVSTQIARHPCPVVFYTHFYPDDWQGNGALCDCFNDFWAELPIHAAQKHLILICVFVHYEGQKAQSRFFDKLLRRADINQQIQTALARMNESWPDNAALSGKVLSELSPIRPRDVHDWIDEFRPVLAKYCDPLELRPQIAQLFGDNPELLMDELSPKLKALLQAR